MFYDKDPDWSEAASKIRMPWALNLAIDSAAASADAISDIIVTDLAHDCLSASLGGLTAGMRVTLDLPLLGRREVDIRWIAGHRAGCRLVTPVEDDELMDAVCASRAIAEYFPGLLGYRPPARWGRA